MIESPVARPAGPLGVEHCPTGISGLDEILSGGLPRGRPTLVCGAAGCGKTVVAMEFLLRGITQYDEPGVFVAFEEGPADLAANFASLGYDLTALEREGRLRVLSIKLDRSEIEETGDYDLEGLFIRLAAAVAAVGARRIVLDTIEMLFAGLGNEAIVRSELRRLFTWIKDQNLTAIVTGEQGTGTLTRYGLEEYVADCVIFLDNQVEGTAAVRRLRVVKFRGSAHGPNRYPFLIDAGGLIVAPITSLRLAGIRSDERVSMGITKLDAILGGGVFRGSSILVSGTAGSGKTSLLASAVDAACARGDRAILFSFEESADQIVRNMRSIGLDLGRWITAGSLQIICVRPTMYGLETHLATFHRAVEAFEPAVVAFDPISSFLSIGSPIDVTDMLVRLIDLLKMRGVTSLFDSLTRGGSSLEETAVAVSSLMDTWLLLRDVETNGERNRVLHVLKSRGTSHSNQVREFRLTDQGVDLVEVFVDGGDVLVGSARVAKTAQARAVAKRAAVDRIRLDARRRRNADALDARIAALRAEYEAADVELTSKLEDDDRAADAAVSEQSDVSLQRHADRGAPVLVRSGGNQP